MLAELAVLGGDSGADHVTVDLFNAHPVARRAAAREQVAEHCDCDRRRHETVGQHPEDRAKDERQHQFDQE
jgi:hypothetical protein